MARGEVLDGYWKPSEGSGHWRERVVDPVMQSADG